MPPDDAVRESTIQLDDYVQPLRTHSRVVALVALVSLGFGIVAALAAPYSYTSTTAILINPISADPTATLESTERSTDLTTEVRIASSRTVMEAASERLAEQAIVIAPETLELRARASAIRDSRVIDISYSASDPAVAEAGVRAVAQAYLDFRTGLTEANKQAARDAIAARIADLQDQLAGIETRLAGLAEGSSSRVLATVEQTTVRGELTAQQTALADLSTVTAGGATIIDRPLVPSSPDGLTGVQTAVGAGAGGIVLGVVTAYVLAAYGSDPKPSRRRRPRRGRTATPDQPLAATAPDSVGEADETAPHRSEPLAAEALLQSMEAELAATEVPVENPAAEPAPAASAQPMPTAGAEPRPPAEVTGFPAMASPVPMGELDPRPAISAIDQTSTQPAGDGPATWDEDFSSSPSTWDDVAIPAPPGYVEMAPTELGVAAEEPTASTAAIGGLAIPIAEPAGRVLTAAGDLDALLDRLRELGATGPVATLTVTDGNLETSLAVGLDLADELQALGARVLVIDALLERPSIGQLFDNPAWPGLNEVLTGKVTLRDAARTLPGLDGLDALAINSASPPAAADVAGPPFERLMAEARTQYHAIVVIAGSIGDFSLVPALAGLVDGIVVGTDLPPGSAATADLVHRVASLPAPTLELLSSPLVMAEPTSNAPVAVGAAGM